MACTNHSQALQQKIDTCTHPFYLEASKRALSFFDASGSAIFHIDVPLAGQKLLLFGITGFAAGHQIEFFRPAPAYQGDDVIHGQFRRCKGFAAIMTDTGGASALPPLGVTQLPGFCPLFFQKYVIHA
jgi:hypothetical protein